ncbi:Hemolysin-type calcium-binding repeat-containing protein [Cryobacterium psychrotolerans]|uniref:Hemolysin-type calcium-binding repeat-containing protein n=1 Tax=Cryobacterium psychrotolerans TaxID=386301 RepID=A0A1G9BUW5_9MICO|nr:MULTISPECIES: calcium-binding protein [Cryobacterium]TFD42958.1 calcium-binding protein [Cryobacterium sp. TMT1-2-1]TFD84084.1 calcium-binding protein [Cryobacterium psychrotolerans]SDK42765.1 Hemolysin-type calcium-binding repeat-containing protein [Cryobacterium psychrotolerans]
MRTITAIVGLTALLMTGGAVVAPSASAATSLNGKTCTIVGTSGNNTLRGTSRNDVICGLGGNDVIYGGSGNDTLDGGFGNDALFGQGGGDTLIGGAGSDTVSYSGTTLAVTADLDGVIGDDGVLGEKDTIRTDVEHIAGGSGSDRLTGNSGNNTMSGGTGNDTISGGYGNDTMVGQGGADVFYGGAGTDTVSYAKATTRVVADLDGITGDDGVTGERDTIKTDVENLVGGAAGDVLAGNNGANALVGGAGSDTLGGGAGNDTLTGGLGTDTSRGGSGTNTCEIETGETRDWTCSLISNLSHLLSTVAGSVSSPGDYMAGCFVGVASPSGGGFDAGSYITPGGSFAFSSPRGPKQGLILKANGSTSCPFHFHLGVFSVSNEMGPLKYVLPELVTVKVVVKNDLGAVIPGVNVLITPLYNSLSIAGTGGSGTASFGMIQVVGISNSQGEFQFKVPRGAGVTVNATASFAGITMEANPVSIETEKTLVANVVFG